MLNRSNVIGLSVLTITGLVCAFSGGDGTAANPYQISTRQDLEAVSNDLSAHYILMNDIDLAGITYTQAIIAPNEGNAANFVGAGFTGILNGNGYAVKNLIISASTKDYIGLFGQIGAGASVSNLSIVNCDIFGFSYVGGLCGENYYGTITSSYATGAVTGVNYSVGGLCGTNYYGTITSSYATGAVSGSGYLGGLCGNIWYGAITSSYATGAVSGGSYVGGLCGHNQSGTITSSYATGAVSGSGTLGGLCGHNQSGTITSSYATGAVSGGSDVGGLCGYSFGTITSSYATGAVSGSRYLGGLCGYIAYGTITSSYATGEVSPGGFSVGGLCGLNKYGIITSSYSTGKVSGNRYVGGLCGEHYGTRIASSFWDIQTSGRTTSAGGTGKTTAEMKTMSTFTDAGWDFVNEDANGRMDAWYMPQGDYPRLYWQAAKGDIDYDDEITEGDLLVLALQWLGEVEENQRLTADINYDGVVNLQDYRTIAEFWLSIGGI